MYLYLAINSEENTSDFYLSKARNYIDAKQFFKKALHSFYISTPRVITVEGRTTDALRYLNYIVE
jgi:transposase-like protein